MEWTALPPDASNGSATHHPVRVEDIPIPSPGRTVILNLLISLNTFTMASRARAHTLCRTSLLVVASLAFFR